MLLMKKTAALLLALVPSVLADEWYDEWKDNTILMAQDVYDNWRHEMPESGFMPSFLSFEFTSNMGERHGASELCWQQYGINVPLADPRRSGGDDWMFNASFNAQFTYVNADGALNLRRSDLYNFSLPISAIVPRPSGNLFIAAVSPAMSSDFVHRAHSFHVNFLVSYQVKHSESLTYSVGLAHSPDATIFALVPVVNFDWRMTPDWRLSLSGFKLTVLRKINERLDMGLFAQGSGGSWAVNRQDGTRMLRIRSLVAGVMAEYDFSNPGETRRIVSLSLGSTLATTVDICHYNSDYDRVEGRHYHPGLFVSGAVDFRF